MPIIQGIDLFSHNNFTVPGGGPYLVVVGSPTRDTSNLPSGEPASVALHKATNDALGYTISGSPGRGWRGFFFRTETLSATTRIGQMTNGAGVRGRLYMKADGGFSITLDDVSFSESSNGGFAQWWWIEQILDYSVNPHALYTQINGVNITPISLAGAVDSVVDTVISSPSTDGGDVRFSHFMWGSATSTSDWLGGISTAVSFAPVISGRGAC